MITPREPNGMRPLTHLTQGISIFLLMVHLYYECYAAFYAWHYTHPFVNRIITNIERTGLFYPHQKPLLFSLVFVILSLIGTRAINSRKPRWRSTMLVCAAGLILYFGSYLILYAKAPATSIAISYMTTCFTGWLLIFGAAKRIALTIALRFDDTPGSREKASFLQPRRRLRTSFSLSWPARDLMTPDACKCYINVAEARRGILVIGSSGAGKSWFVIEPAMRAFIQKGYSMLVFDLKYDVLTRKVYDLFYTYRQSYPAKARFYSINFTDLSRTHRCNVIPSITMRSLSDAIGISRAIMLSFNPSWSRKEGDFFVESPINFVAALIWFLKKYEDGKYCTLPHVIELAHTPYEELFTILNTEPDTQTLINPFIQVFKNESLEILDSQLSSAKIPLGRLSGEDTYYILSGDDVPLDINSSPMILCIGGDPSRQETLAPLLSVLIDRINKIINRPGQHPCALILDEFASIRAASVLHTLATGRSNNIITLLAIQELGQLRTRYTRDEADTIMNMTGTLICGQTAGETAQWISHRFPSIEGHRTTISTNSTDTSVSKSESSNPSITSSTIANLSSGEFVGILADAPQAKTTAKSFHARFEQPEPCRSYLELDIVKRATPATLRENFIRIKEEIRALVKAEMRRVMSDPAMTQGRL